VSVAGEKSHASGPAPGQQPCPNTPNTAWCCELEREFARSECWEDGG
jgi:hypothetical protein